VGGFLNRLGLAGLDRGKCDIPLFREFREIGADALEEFDAIGILDGFVGLIEKLKHDVLVLRDGLQRLLFLMKRVVQALAEHPLKVGLQVAGEVGVVGKLLIFVKVRVDLAQAKNRNDCQGDRWNRNNNKPKGETGAELQFAE
jgi:hypothetical protein